MGGVNTNWNQGGSLHSWNHGAANLDMHCLSVAPLLDLRCLLHCLMLSSANEIMPAQNPTQSENPLISQLLAQPPFAEAALAADLITAFFRQLLAALAAKEIFKNE